jgi:hypothetical protein
LASLETRTMPVQSTQVREVTGPDIVSVSRLAKEGERLDMRRWVDRMGKFGSLDCNCYLETER